MGVIKAFNSLKKSLESLARALYVSLPKETELKDKMTQWNNCLLVSAGSLFISWA